MGGAKALICAKTEKMLLHGPHEARERPRRLHFLFKTPAEGMKTVAASATDSA
jgi:hypothetical protein